MRATRTLLAVVLLAACGSPHRGPAMPTVPVEGSSRDVRLLAGTWKGEFVARQGERRGTIAFAFRAGGDTARGQVVLQGSTPPGCTDPVSRATVPETAGEIALGLARVNVGGVSVGGWLRPYRDPELGCWMDTWFEGTLSGDTVAGMYFSHPADTTAALRLGTWWAARQR